MRVDDERVGELDAVLATSAPPRRSTRSPRTPRRRAATRPRRAHARRARAPGRPRRTTSCRRSRRRTRRRRGRSRRPCIRSSSSTGTLRSSIPSMRASFSTEECACSEQTTTLRPVTCRAAISAASVDVDAVSSMWPCQPSGRPSSCRTQSTTRSSSSVDGGRRAPDERDLVHRRREQLGEDPRLRRGDREVREEARVLPVRQRGHDQLVEVAQDVGERLGLLRRRHRQLRGQLAGLHLREHRQLADALEIAAPPSRARRRRPRGSHSRPLLPQLVELLPRARVGDVVLRQPAAPRLPDRELDVAPARGPRARRS